MSVSCYSERKRQELKAKRKRKRKELKSKREESLEGGRAERQARMRKERHATVTEYR